MVEVATPVPGLGLPNAGPFNFGQLQVQTTIGVRDKMEGLGRRVIRDYMTQQAKDFFHELPFVFTAVKNSDGKVWATTLTGQPGFIEAKDDHHLLIHSKQMYGDPAKFRIGHALGAVGVMLHNRRRNKLRGRVSSIDGDKLMLEIKQSLGNCPKYIQLRSVSLDDIQLVDLGKEKRRVVEGESKLGKEQLDFISRADTAFLASSFSWSEDGKETTETCECNHRGGVPGFVQATAEGVLKIPDYVGNSMFQSYGNISACPAVGLQFIDFSNGDSLQLTGTAEILYNDHTLPGAQRALRFVTSNWVHVWNGLPFHTEGPPEPSPYNPLPDSGNQGTVELTGRWPETHDISTFQFRIPKLTPGKPFCEAGQFASFDFPNIKEGETINRTWTISSPPSQTEAESKFTISVKKAGTVSGYLHDHLKIGHKVVFRGVDGDFTLSKSVRSIPQAGIMLVAGGIGVTPVRVMFAEALEKGYPVSLLYIIRSMEDAAFLKEFQEGAKVRDNVKLGLALTKDKLQEDLDSVMTFHGRPNSEMLKKICPDIEEREIFQCGPIPMMNSISSIIEGMGISLSKLHQESFSF